MNVFNAMVGFEDEELRWLPDLKARVIYNYFWIWATQVFLLDSSLADVRFFFNTQLTNKPSATVALEQMAEQISTFCSTLKEFPSIRFR